MEIWELIAREEIRECITGYNTYGDSGKFEQMLGVFTDDAVMESGGGTYVGKAAIRDLMTGAGRSFADHATESAGHAQTPLVRHFTSTVRINVTSETEATATMYYLVLTHGGLDHWGRYRDEYRKVEGRWLISRRRERTDGATPGGMAASLQ
jgi:hypothetical protein